MRYFRCAKFHFFNSHLYYICQINNINKTFNYTFTPTFTPAVKEIIQITHIIIHLPLFISFLFLRRKRKEMNQRKENSPLLGQEPSKMAIGLFSRTRLRLKHTSNLAPNGAMHSFFLFFVQILYRFDIYP